MIVELAGGVGGAKLAQGLALALPPGDLTVIVNTGDDFDLYGLRICPDLDTVMYTLAGIVDPGPGWGVQNDTTQTLNAIARYGREPWFKLGDQDFATHILRTERLRQGASLTDVTGELSSALGVESALLPMTDDRVATMIDSPAGRLAFQDYFVARRQSDDVLGVEFIGAERARPSTAALAAIDGAELIVLGPSNPIVSVGPILAVPGFETALNLASAPIVAVSPIVGGKALKGPADRMLATLGHEVSAVGVAALYASFVDAIVIDESDRDLEPRIRDLGLDVLVTRTVMGGDDDRRRLADEVVDFGRAAKRPAGVAR
jgi:LPPG:FO 2-phospho-L-lactate transferase